MNTRETKVAWGERWIDLSLACWEREVRRLAPVIVKAGGWRFTPQWIDARVVLLGGRDNGL